MAYTKQLLASIVEIWQKQIVAAEKKKREQFGNQAAECWRFYTKDYKDIYLAPKNQPGGEPFPEPTYKIHLALAREFVNLLLPHCHYRVPDRLCSPGRPPLSAELVGLLEKVSGALDQQAAVRAGDLYRKELMQQFLQWNHKQYRLTNETRMALPEALVKGRAVLWTELADTPSGVIPVSTAESVDGLLIDPDCIRYRDAGYIVRQRNRSAWQVAEEFGIPVGRLRKSYESTWAAALGNDAAPATPVTDENRGDIVTYYEIYSRMGVGTLLRDPPQDMKDVAEILELAGDNVYLAICPGVPYPLNLQPEVLESPNAGTEIRARLSWPIPLFENFDNPWPAQLLDFHPNCDNPWTRSPLEGALPKLRFLDRAYSFLFGRVRTTCRDIIVTSSAMAEPLKTAIREGYDQSVVTVDGTIDEEVAKLFHVLQFPTLNADFYRALELVQQAFERDTGMTPLLAGQEGRTQIRVAADIEARESHVMTRPQDYASAVEEWQSRIAQAEMIAARLTTRPETIARLVGEPEAEEREDQPRGGWGPLTAMWLEHIFTDNPGRAASEIEVTVEAGTGRRKNKQAQAQNVQQIVQTLGPVYGNIYTASQFQLAGPLNGLAAMIAEQLDLPPDKLMVPVMPPPPPEETPKSKKKE